MGAARRRLRRLARPGQRRRGDQEARRGRRLSQVACRAQDGPAQDRLHQGQPRGFRLGSTPSTTRRSCRDSITCETDRRSTCARAERSSASGESAAATDRRTSSDPSRHLQGRARRHYASDEVDALCKSAAVDVLLVHDAPAGVKFEKHLGGVGWMSEAAGLDRLVARMRPLVCFFGHHHARIDGEVAGIRCIGLNKVRMPGNLVAIDVEPGCKKWTVLGEYP